MCFLCIFPTLLLNIEIEKSSNCYTENCSEESLKVEPIIARKICKNIITLTATIPNKLLLLLLLLSFAISSQFAANSIYTKKHLVSTSKFFPPRLTHSNFRMFFCFIFVSLKFCLHFSIQSSINFNTQTHDNYLHLKWKRVAVAFHAPFLRSLTQPKKKPNRARFHHGRELHDPQNVLRN